MSLSQENIMLSSQAKDLVWGWGWYMLLTLLFDNLMQFIIAACQEWQLRHSFQFVYFSGTGTKLLPTSFICYVSPKVSEITFSLPNNQWLGSKLSYINILSQDNMDNSLFTVIASCLHLQNRINTGSICGKLIF